MDMKMEHPDDIIEQVDDIALFSLNKINTKKVRNLSLSLALS